MKLFGRRSFLRALGAAPLAGRAAAEAVVKQLGHIGVGISGSCVPSPETLRDAVTGKVSGTSNIVGNSTSYWNWTATAKREAMRMILADRDRDAELRAIIYQSHRRIYHIDPDIGGMRSWSLAAKIAFQRQRIVDEEVKEALQETTSWRASREWVEDQLKNFLLR